MISDLAISEIEQLKANGLHPTPTDIVRLNALGLRIKEAEILGDFYELPRVAYLGNLCFREPTLAHLTWLDRVKSYITIDADTFAAVNAFALSRNADKLPPAEERKQVAESVAKFVKSDLAPFTYMQIFAATCFAMKGVKETVGEFPAPANAEKRDPTDAPSSVGVGLLLEGTAVCLGISIRDISRLTARQVILLRDVALRRASREYTKSMVHDAECDFFRTLDEIQHRLESEKQSSSSSSSSN